MAKSVTLISNKDGVITDAIIRTPSVWYYVSKEYVLQTTGMKFCHPAFIEAEKKIKELEV